MPTALSNVFPPIKVSVGITIGPPGPAGANGGLSRDMVIVAAQKQTDLGGFVVIGSRLFDPASFGAQLTGVRFSAIIAASPGVTTEVRLYNLTDSVGVDNSVLSTSANIDTALSVFLGIPADLPNSTKLYEVQIRISGGTASSTDRAICTFAGIEAITS